MATNAGSRMGALLVQLADFRTRCDARVQKWLGRPRRPSGARWRTGHEHEQLFRTLIEHSPDFIARYNRRREVVYANPAMQQIPGGGGFRLAPAAEVGTPAGQLDYEDCIRVTLRAASAREAEFQYDGPNGDVRWVAVRFVPEPGERGQPETVLAVGRDITDIVHYREKVRQLAFFDPLTDLPNRAWLKDRLPAALAYADAGRRQIGLLVLDLDSFKEVNDVLGHACGDQLLRAVSMRLLQGKRGDDAVVRLGGDEFAILAPVHDDDLDLAIIASRILMALAEPVVIDGNEVFMTGSIGISRYPRDGSDAATLLRYADSAMYAAKRIGGNQFCFHDPATTRAAVERMELGMALHGAAHAGELVLLYQPIVGLGDAGLVGAEALLRWNHPGRGLLTPDIFIKVAEDNGTIVEIGDWVLAAACEAVVRWNAGRAVPMRISVNVSGRQFVMNDLARSVQAALAASGCAPQWLTLEITESLLLENDQNVGRTLDELNEMGVAIAIDDFGTGYSAISYLGHFPISTLKIDRSFVRDIDARGKNLALVKAMISMAESLGLDVVAEGVETQQQADVLASLECHRAQGYLFGRPMPEVQFVAYAQSGKVV
ncbi:MULTISPECIES: putative bifunctional diguanylate cyclase/phosphodiesterase [Paraburkholderia]|jgi:diguanylate cyclase (GGDEF)-like protein/PAS domain S-box-containing protein|nr:EAL domain-containing protein [Paraburkholderia phenazinium]